MLTIVGKLNLMLQLQSQPQWLEMSMYIIVTLSQFTVNKIDIQYFSIHNFGVFFFNQILLVFR